MLKIALHKEPSSRKTIWTDPTLGRGLILACMKINMDDDEDEDNDELFVIKMSSSITK